VAGAGTAYHVRYGDVERLADYYPFEPVGRTWEYVVTELGPGAGMSRTGIATFTVLGPSELNGKPTVVVTVNRQMGGMPNEPGAKVIVRNHFVVTPEQIQQLAVEWTDSFNPMQHGRVTYTPPITVGRLPLTPGGTWEASTQIQSPREGEPDFRADSKRYVRVIGKETVVVPAGRFEVVRLEVKTSSTRVGGTRATESTRVEWRARGPGLVRLTEGPFELALKSHNDKP